MRSLSLSNKNSELKQSHSTISEREAAKHCPLGKEVPFYTVPGIPKSVRPRPRAPRKKLGQVLQCHIIDWDPYLTAISICYQRKTFKSRNAIHKLHNVPINRNICHRVHRGHREKKKEGEKETALTTEITGYTGKMKSE